MTITELDLILMVIPGFLGAWIALAAHDYMTRKYYDNK